MERTQDNRSSERFDRLVLLFASRPRDGWEDVFEEAAVVSFRGFGVEEVVTVLHSALSFEEKMPETVQRSLIMDAVLVKARAEDHRV